MKIFTSMVGRRGGGGFTLIELLVVISIIALMIAILLPALKSARDAGRNVVCLSNVRTQALAFVLYVEDNSGWAPSVFDINWASSGGRTWPDRFLQSQYITSLETVICPNEEIQPTERNFDGISSLSDRYLVAKTLSYGLSGRTWGWFPTHPQHQMVKLEAMLNARGQWGGVTSSKLIVFADSTPLGTPGSHSSTNGLVVYDYMHPEDPNAYYRVRLRHSNGRTFNTSSVDGSARSLDIVEWADRDTYWYPINDKGVVKFP